VFDSSIACKSTWLATTVQPGDRESISPNVAVGLDDGTVDFMELRNIKQTSIGEEVDLR
jgi:hypothetical protein